MTQRSPVSRSIQEDSPALREAAALDRAGRNAEAIATLSRAAAAGNLAAKRTVGLRIMLGDRAPFLGSEGARLVFEAAEAGDPRSADLAAVLVGAGIHCVQHWDTALNWLQRAAELGSPSAGGALRALCADRELVAREEGAADYWSMLRASTDIAPLVAPPCARTLHRVPAIQSAINFAHPWLCKWLMEQARRRLKRAEVYNPHTGGLERTPDRTNSAALMNLFNTDLAQIVLQARIAATVGKPFGNLEPAFVLHYAPGQLFHDHYDFVDPDTPGYRDEIARNGQRVMTFLLYLNDDYENGETEFPRLGLRHRGTLGEGFFFANVTETGEPATITLHAGRPPSKGEKWVLTQFVRDRTLVPGHISG